MTGNTNSSVNSGVQTNSGMDFQKHCTVYLFLENYGKLSGNKYFIILEHHEDIVFGYLEDSGELSKIETYQAKKSTNSWTLSGLLEIINKITKTSQYILNDPHPKSVDFYQENYFTTNNTIELKTSLKKKGQKKPIEYKTKIDETNSLVKYDNLDTNIQNKIKAGNKTVKFSSIDILNLDTLYFNFVDLGRTAKTQIEQLHGKFASVFGDKITDHSAALKVFISCLDEIDSIFNQGNVALLSDKSKRLESDKIDSILNILTTKKMAYDYWRDKGDEICDTLNVTILDRNKFILHYENSFDEFKDLKSSEHKKVHNFILSNKSIFGNHTTDSSCIEEFLTTFNSTQSTTFSPLHLKAVISAAFIEIKHTAL